MGDLKISRREFVSRVAVVTGGLTAGLQVPWTGASEAADGKPLRVVFATDSHLMVNNQLHSEDGLRAALGAIESLTPKPDLILFGGDLTHESPMLDFPAAEQLIDRFLKIWKDHTDLPSFFTFGNHDLVGTKNASVNREDPRFGKGLYRMRLALERDFFAFRKSGWRFIVLDDVLPEQDGSYVGEFAEEQLAFLRAELQTDSQMPTVICGHIPSVSVLPSPEYLREDENQRSEYRDSSRSGSAQCLRFAPGTQRDQGKGKTCPGRSPASSGADSNRRRFVSQRRCDLWELVEGSTNGLPGGFCSARSASRRHCRVGISILRLEGCRRMKMTTVCTDSAGFPVKGPQRIRIIP
jgi:hypothetical protein